MSRFPNDGLEVDPVSRAIIGVMGGAGIRVEIAGDPADVAISARTEDGHTHVHRGPDLYDTLCPAVGSVGARAVSL